MMKGKALGCVLLVLVYVTCCSAVTVKQIGFGENTHGVTMDSSGWLYKQEAEEGQPWFCHGLECPAYEVDVDATKLLRDAAHMPVVEVRQYGSVSWVQYTTKIEQHYAHHAFDVLPEGFLKLYEYIGGMNKEGKVFDMAVPVEYEVVTSADQEMDFEHGEIRIKFFAPAPDMPEPLDPSLSLVSDKPQKYAVMMTRMKFNTESATVLMTDLVRSVIEAGLSRTKGRFIFAGYDSPFRFNRLHNEAMVPVE